MPTCSLDRLGGDKALGENSRRVDSAQHEVPRAALGQGGRLASGTLHVASLAQRCSVPHRVPTAQRAQPTRPVPGARCPAVLRREAQGPLGQEPAGGQGLPCAWLPLPPARSGSFFKGEGLGAASGGAVSGNAAQSPLRGKQRGSHRHCHISPPTSTFRVILNDTCGKTPSCVFRFSGASSL